jgi:hypothetical protein
MIEYDTRLMEDPAECKNIEFILADLIQYLASLLSSVVGLQDQTAWIDRTWGRSFYMSLGIERRLHFDDFLWYSRPFLILLLAIADHVP